jgi:hypothetical protein
VPTFEAPVPNVAFPTIQDLTAFITQMDASGINVARAASTTVQAEITTRRLADSLPFRHNYKTGIL